MTIVVLQYYCFVKASASPVDALRLPTFFIHWY